jgi:hypothetical protein
MRNKVKIKHTKNGMFKCSGKLGNAYGVTPELAKTAYNVRLNKVNRNEVTLLIDSRRGGL